MDNVLIDDRRIHVDFSQSVSKMRWRGKGRGIDYYDEVLLLGIMVFSRFQFVIAYQNLIR